MDEIVQLTNFVKEYAIDTDARYAIALTGEWGSGKTRYINGTLKTELKKSSINLIRVSLFGVADSGSFFDRFAYALFASKTERQATNSGPESVWKRLSGWSKRHGVARAVGEASISFAQTKLKSVGITYQPGSEAITNLFLQSNDLVVLDDIERAEKSFLENELFGIANNLVEGNNCKLLLVSNSLDCVDDDTREKLIWKAREFRPCPEDLARDILCDVACDCEEIGFYENIILAACETDCRNARAMLKAKPMFEMLAHSTVFSSENYALDNRKQTLRDLMKYALLIPSGKAPKKPSGNERETDSEAFLRIMETLQYERYCDAFAIINFYSEACLATQEDVDEMARTYLEKHYPGSENAMKLKSALTALSNIRWLDDREVESALVDAVECLRDGDYDMGDLLQTINMLSQYKSFGFDAAISQEELETLAMSKINSDPELAFNTFHSEYSTWAVAAGLRNRPLLSKLDAAVVEAYDSMSNTEDAMLVNVNDPNCGSELVKLLEKRAMRGQGFSSISNRLFLNCFLNSDAASQSAMGDYFRKEANLRNAGVVDSEIERQWLSELLTAIDESTSKSKAGAVRLKWLRNDVEQLLERYRIPNG